jgi:hypothetical protein
MSVVVHAAIFGSILYFLVGCKERFQNNNMMPTMLAANPNNLQRKEGFAKLADGSTVTMTKFNLMAAAWAFMILWFVDLLISHFAARLPILYTILPIVSIILAIAGFLTD